MRNNQTYCRRYVTLFICVLGLMQLQSCSTSAPETVAPTFTADPTAFEYAVKQAAEFQIYADECSGLSSQLAAQAQSALNSWNQRNWPQVYIADQNYSKNLESQTILYNGEKISLPAVSLYADIKKSVKMKLDQTRHSHSNIIATCNTKLTGYESGQYDLSTNRNADLYLKSLVTGDVPPAYKVPALTGTLNVLSVPGRSQFNLEKTLQDEGCASARILTLRNEWPHESYGAFCADGKTTFVACEWGECSKH